MAPFQTIFLISDEGVINKSLPGISASVPVFSTSVDAGRSLKKEKLIFDFSFDQFKSKGRPATAEVKTTIIKTETKNLVWPEDFFFIIAAVVRRVKAEKGKIKPRNPDRDLVKRRQR